jgi:hypothetical protein
MRYIVVDEDRGVFLGSFNQYALFAKNDILGSTKAFSFDTQDEAEEYIEKVFSKNKNAECKVIEIEAKNKYVRVEDIIKQGYGMYTHYLVDNLPMQSDSFH